MIECPQSSHFMQSNLSAGPGLRHWPGGGWVWANKIPGFIFPPHFGQGVARSRVARSTCFSRTALLSCGGAAEPGPHSPGSIRVALFGSPPEPPRSFTIPNSRSPSGYRITFLAPDRRCTDRSNGFNFGPQRRRRTGQSGSPCTRQRVGSWQSACRVLAIRRRPSRGCRSLWA
jgi:hypothetical protein